MAQLVECVPNFSEGQSKEVIEAIAGAIASTPGCNLLDVDPGSSTNRTVYTFAGSPSAVIEGALNAAKVAFRMIDMTKHTGEHPRMGALDVCPFIPLRDVTMEDCVRCAKSFGELLARELNVPVYLYGEAATEPHRKTLPQIRAGEYEAIPDKIVKDEWKPDFGPQKFIPNWGATATGARKFLIAYNINLLSTKEQAHRIALNIREQGRSKDQPGRLQHVQAIGWWLDEANLAQISANILDHDITPIHAVFEESSNDAKEMNLAVVGSQIVGLVPLSAMLQVADYYMEKENLFILEEQQKIRLVINRLGLSSIAPFVPKERIIEYLVEGDEDGHLIHMDLKSFIMNVAARTPTPGGGTVAALTSTLGSALGLMVGQLTYGNKKFEHLDATMRKLITKFYRATKSLIDFIDADSAAYTEYMLTVKLPKDSPEDAEARVVAMQTGLKNAVAVPMNVAIITNQVWEPLKEMAETGNVNCKSDVEVAAKCLETGVFGARCNVLTNLTDIKDEDYVTRARVDIDKQWQTAQDECAKVLAIMEQRSK